MNTLTQLKKRKSWENFERVLFGFLIGNVFTALIYYIAAKQGFIEVIYK